MKGLDAVIGTSHTIRCRSAFSQRYPDCRPSVGGGAAAPPGLYSGLNISWRDGSPVRATVFSTGMSVYEYDVFISYPNRAPVADWVRNHFYPLLAQWLPECTPVDHEPAIFVDFNSIDTAAEWPVSIRRALKQSRCLVPVFCPAYFRSAWCCSELETMRQREAAVGLRTEDHPHGLIYHVVFWDGEFFPEHARTIQQRNLSRWADPYPTFSQTVAYSEFLATIRTICQEIAGLILAAPMFDCVSRKLRSN